MNIWKYITSLSHSLITKVTIPSEESVLPCLCARISTIPSEESVLPFFGISTIPSEESVLPLC